MAYPVRACVKMACLDLSSPIEFVRLCGVACSACVALCVAACPLDHVNHSSALRRVGPPRPEPRSPVMLLHNIAYLPFSILSWLAACFVSLLCSVLSPRSPLCCVMPSPIQFPAIFLDAQS